MEERPQAQKVGDGDAKPQVIIGQKEMIKKVLTITLGVFLGILFAVWAVNRYQEERKSNEELDESMAEMTLTILQPDDVIGRCGKPIKDVFNSALHERILIYSDPFFTDLRNQSPRGSGENVVTIEFDHLRTMSWAFRGIYKGSVNFPKIIEVKGDARKKIGVLPCIERKKE